MKTFSRILFFLAIAGLMTACKGGPKGEKAETKDKVNTTKVSDGNAVTYKVGTGGIINWEGTKVVGSGHNGTINIQSGEINVTGDKITGGSFVIDMASITDTSIDDAEMKGKLEGHLKNEDFFDVGKFPTSKFEITSVSALKDDPDANHIVSGNLTLKEKTKNITFKAKIDATESGFAITTPNFVIDRTDFDVKYGSGKFFDNLAKDRIINDKIGLSLAFNAAK